MNHLENLKSYLKTIDEVIENGKYKDNWESLMYHPVPEWYRNAKFGIFIHWGAYSVPAYSEWYARVMYQKGEKRDGNDSYQHHIDTYGAHKDFGYKDIADKLFKAENFDAKYWLDIFQDAGARFIMPTAEHHDGFPIYNTDLSDWCSAKKGPKRDFVGELKKECDAHGIVLTTSSHRAEHYWFMGGGKQFESDMTGDEPYGHIYWPSVQYPEDHDIFEATEGFDPSQIFMEDWLARTCEIVDKYRPKIMYFDWWIQIKAMKPYLKKFAAYYYNRALEWGEEVTINYKNDAFMFTVGVRDFERGQLAAPSPDFWQNDTSITNYSWEYLENNEPKNPTDIICDLVDVVAKNGSLLLNVGPKADGSFPESTLHILNEIGAWMDLNSEGIYDTQYWKKSSEGPTVTPEGHMSDDKRSAFTTEDFRFTFKDGNLYVFAMKWPEDGVVRIKTLGRTSGQLNAFITDVKVFGGENVRHKLCDEHLTVMAEGITTDKPVLIRLTLD